MLGFHLVFCVRTPESFSEARKERLKVSGNPAQYDNLQVFIDEQAVFRQVVKKSILPSMELDISHVSIPAAVNSIADWLEETGGLWAK